MCYLINNKPIANNNAQPNISREMLKNLIIPIPSMKEQENLVKQIESIEKDQKTHLEYSKIIQSKIDMIENIIKKQNKISLEKKEENKIDNFDSVNNTDENDEDDEDENNSKIVKRTKSIKNIKSSKKIIKEESEDEEEIESKPKSKKNN